MRILLLSAALVWMVPAHADDRSDCKSGITMIQAEIAKKPPQATLKKRKRPCGWRAVRIRKANMMSVSTP